MDCNNKPIVSAFMMNRERDVFENPVNELISFKKFLQLLTMTLAFKDCGLWQIIVHLFI